MSTREIENLLIMSVYSDNYAKNYFINNINDKELFETLLRIAETSQSGDARMEAAFYISVGNESFIEENENRLLILMDDELYSISNHIMIALSRIQSEKAYVKIIEDRLKDEHYWESKALLNYVHMFDTSCKNKLQ